MKNWTIFNAILSEDNVRIELKLSEIAKMTNTQFAFLHIKNMHNKSRFYLNI